LKRPKILLGLLVTLALILSMFSTALPVYAADVGLTKGVTPATPNAYRLGDTIHYVLSIRNRSAVENIVIEAVWDVLPDGYTVYPTGPSLPYTLTPGTSQSYTYDWVATVTGTVVNTFYARGYQISTGGGHDAWVMNTQKSSLVIDPNIDIEKYVKDNTATWQDADSATGPSIPSRTWVVFRFTIHNTGDVALTSVNLTDTDMSTFYTDEACTTSVSFPTTLAVDETKTYYSRLAWAAGQHDDEATARGKPRVGSDVEDKDKAYYFGSTAPLIDVEKYVWDGATWYDADLPTGPYLVSGPVVFRFVITNNGNVNLTNVTLTDVPAIGTFYTNQGLTIPATLPIPTLAPTASQTFYGSLPWGQGQHTDTATATGTPPVGAPVSDSDPANYYGPPPSIDVEKYVWDGATWHDADTPAGPSLTSAQNPVVFRFVITNNCGVNLTNVTLTDVPAIGTFYTNQGLTIPATLPIPTLAPTASVTVYGSLPWGQGQHTDAATATGTPPVGAPVSDTDPSHYFGATTPPPPTPTPTVGWETYPVNKLRVLLPWIGLLAAIIAGASLLVLRRRRLS
jgi:uncharacterized repeat protein (TIGR01451 family)